MKRSLIALLGAALVSGAVTTASAASADWKLALQAWTFNKDTFCATVDKAKALGLKYIEAFPGQVVGGDMEGKLTPDLDAATQKKILAKLKSAGVTLVNFGVTGAKDEAGWTKLFEFAKAMGIQTIVSEPAPEQMPLVDKLANKYKINVAIHNHPQPSRYWNPDAVLAAIKGCGKRVGACADTGHWVRSGLCPLESLKKLQGHIISLHFKDLAEKSPKTHDVPWGSGISNPAAMLAELKRQGFKGVFSIEYEHTTPHLMCDVQKCACYFNHAAPLSAKDLLAGKALPGGFSWNPEDIWANVKPDAAGKWSDSMMQIATAAQAAAPEQKTKKEVKKEKKGKKGKKKNK